MNERIPPHNLDAEEAVLAALLTDAQAGDSVMGVLEAKDFYRDAHQVIFEAIQRIMHANQRPDLVTLGEELNRTKKLDQAGGINYINGILDKHISNTYNVAEHARIVAEKARLRNLIGVGNRIVANCYTAEDDAQSIIDQAEVDVLSVSGTIKAESTFAAIGDVVTTNIKRMYELAENNSEVTGLSTGFRELDKITRGLQPSDLILVAARPSMGKTAFTLNIAQTAGMRCKKSVAFFSLEMSKEQLVMRMLSNAASVGSDSLRTGTLDANEWDRVVKASQIMSEAAIYIDETPGLTPQMMRSKLRRLKKEKGLDLVVVDYIQLMQGSRAGGGENRQQEISEISRNLKLIARELDVPVIALSQLSRSVESRPDKRPILSDLRESGSLEQDADIVMFLYREKYYDENTEKGDLTEVIIRKHRNGGLGTVNLAFTGEFTRFNDVLMRTPDGAEFEG